MHIRSLQEIAYGNAKAKGFHERERPIPEALMLIVTEVAEAMEALRDNQLLTFRDEKGKPQGLPSELADIIIRVADLAQELDINLEEEIKLKLSYNITREFMHGGKLM